MTVPTWQLALPVRVPNLLSDRAVIVAASVELFVTRKVNSTLVPVSGIEATPAVLVTVMSGSGSFVKTHFTVSPGSTLKVAVPVAMLPVLGVALAPSLQVIDFSSQSVGTASVER